MTETPDTTARDDGDEAAGLITHLDDRLQQRGVAAVEREELAVLWRLLDERDQMQQRVETAERERSDAAEGFEQARQKWRSDVGEAQRMNDRIAARAADETERRIKAERERDEAREELAELRDRALNERPEESKLGDARFYLRQWVGKNFGTWSTRPEFLLVTHLAALLDGVDWIERDRDEALRSRAANPVTAPGSPNADATSADTNTSHEDASVADRDFPGGLCGND